MLWGRQLDVLAYNRGADTIFSFDSYDGPFATNQAWRLFMDPKRHALYEDFEDIAARTAAALRARAAERAGQPDLEGLIDALRTNSKEFARLWDETKATAPLERFELRLRHPRLGRLRFARVALLLATEPDLTLVMLAGADARTASALSRLSRRATRR
jgi:hypothetical protein